MITSCDGRNVSLAQGDDWRWSNQTQVSKRGASKFDWGGPCGLLVPMWNGVFKHGSI